MLHPEPGRSANRNTAKLAAAAAAMTLLFGCAMAMPLRPLATSSQDSRDRDFYCRADPKCSLDELLPWAWATSRKTNRLAA